MGGGDLEREGRTGKAIGGPRQLRARLGTPTCPYTTRWPPAAPVAALRSSKSRPNGGKHRLPSNMYARLRPPLPDDLKAGDRGQGTLHP